MRHVGDILSIGTDGQYRLICTYSGKTRSKWLIEEFRTRSFLWWKWSGWETFEYALGYGIAGYSYGHTETFWIDHEESDEDLTLWAESNLEFLGINIE